MRIEALDKPQLAHMLSHLLETARGLPVVLNDRGPWAVIWGEEEYPSLMFELECCRFSFPTMDALPSKNFRCPHGNWVVKYVS